MELLQCEESSGVTGEMLCPKSAIRTVQSSRMFSGFKSRGIAPREWTNRITREIPTITFAVRFALRKVDSDW
jgi:hypothetical protein